MSETTDRKPIMVKGKDLNKTLLDIITNRRNGILNDGSKAVKAAADADVEKLAEDVYIQKSDKDEYNCLNELENIFLKFGTKDDSEKDLCDAHDLYEIPGVKVTIDGHEKELAICVHKDKIKQLAQRAKDYEKVFGRSLGLKFPNQIYQFRFDENIPDEKYAPMRPKYADESEEQYEQATRVYYKLQGVNPVPTEDGVYRKPFPHELVDYKGDKPVRKTENQSEYYERRYKALHTKKTTPPKAETGKKHRVTASEVYDYKKAGIWENIKTFFGGAKSKLKTEEPRRIIKYVTITGAAVGVGLYAGLSTGILPALIPTAVGLGLFAYIRHRIKKKRKDDDEEEKEKPREPKPTGEGGDKPKPETPKPGAPKPSGKGEGKPAGTPGGDSGTPVPPTPPKPDDPKPTRPEPHMVTLGEGLDENLASLKDNHNQIRNYDNQIILIKDQLDHLSPSAPDYESQKAALEARLSQMRNLQKQALANLREDVIAIMNSYHLSPEEGGPKL